MPTLMEQLQLELSSNLTYYIHGDIKNLSRPDADTIRVHDKIEFDIYCRNNGPVAMTRIESLLFPMASLQFLDDADNPMVGPLTTENAVDLVPNEANWIRRDIKAKVLREFQLHSPLDLIVFIKSVGFADLSQVRFEDSQIFLADIKAA